MAVPLHTAAQIRSLEQRLAHDRGLDPWTLMQRAGEALLRCIGANWPEARRILVLAGCGNNGGDGYVLANLLRDRVAACHVHVLAVGEAASDPARMAAAAWHSAGGATSAWQPGDALPAADLIVDALLGIGLSRPLDGTIADLVAAANAHRAPILAVDVPSGLDADTGAMQGDVIRATRTHVLLARKRGVCTGMAPDVVGTVSFDDLGACEPDPHGQEPVGVDDACLLLERDDLRRWLPRRRRAAHKGDHGHVLVVGGDAGMSGAIRLAGAAALRSGAGWTSVATRADHAGIVALHRPELMVHGIEDAHALAPLLQRADVVAIGPGLGQGVWARTMFDAIGGSGMARVFDADALNLLAASPRALGARDVLTPHPGEAARLLGCDVASIERNRFAAARAIAQCFGAVVALKGAGTIIDDGERSAVCPFGNPGMAAAGMGDALTGVIAAFMAQGIPAFEASAAGVLAHALAGDAAAADGERGLAASDLIDHLRSVVNP